MLGGVSAEDHGGCGDEVIEINRIGDVAKKAKNICSFYIYIHDIFLIYICSIMNMARLL